VVDFADAALAAAAGVGNVDSAAITIGLGDADSSGSVTTRDALVIARFVAGLSVHSYLGLPVGRQEVVVQPGTAVTIFYAGGAAIEIVPGELAAATRIAIEEIHSDSSADEDSVLGPAFEITVSEASAGSAAALAARQPGGFARVLRQVQGSAARASGAGVAPGASSSTGLLSYLVLPLWRSATRLANPKTYVRYTVAALTFPAYAVVQVTRQATGLALRTGAAIGSWAVGAAKGVKVRAQAWHRSPVVCEKNIRLHSEARPGDSYINVVVVHGIQLGIGSVPIACSYFNPPRNESFWGDLDSAVVARNPALAGKIRFHRFVYPSFNSPTLAADSLASMLADGSKFEHLPVMIVAQSMGGLVAAEALRMARPDTPIVRLATFGTPFAGSVLAQPAVAAEACAAAAAIGGTLLGLGSAALACAGAVYVLFPSEGMQSLRPGGAFIAQTLVAPPSGLFFAHASDVLNQPLRNPLASLTLAFAAPDTTDASPFGNDGVVKVSSALRFPSASTLVARGIFHISWADPGPDLDFTASAVASLVGTAPFALVAVSGNAQTLVAGQRSAPLVVKVTSVLGQPLSGIQVTFSGGPQGSQVVATDPSGFAFLEVEMPTPARSLTVSAAVPGIRALAFVVGVGGGPVDYEPNDSPATATSISPGETQQQSLDPASDVDWLRLQITQPTDVVLTMTGASSANHVHDFDLYAANGTTVLAQAGGLLSNGLTLAYPQAPVGALVRICADIGDSYCDTHGVGDLALGPYAVTFTVAPPADPFEPNNTIGGATPIALGTPQTHSIHSFSDVDVLRPQLTGATDLTVAVTATSGAGRFTLQLLDSTGAHVANVCSASAGAGATLTYPNAPPNVYVRVVGATSCAATSTTMVSNQLVGSYTVQVTGVAVGAGTDAYEPNNTVATATPIALGASQEHGIRYLRDVDVLQLQVAQGTAFALDVTVPSGSQRFTIQLLDASGVHVANACSASSGAGVTLNVPSAPAAAFARIVALGPSSCAGTSTTTVSSQVVGSYSMMLR